MRQIKRIRNNRGSTILEVTLIMPILLMMMVLFITMLLGVFQQAKIHSELMFYSAGQEESNWQNSAVTLSVQKDKRTFSQKTSVTLVQGYDISCEVTQTVRSSSVEDNLRRWQILGDMAAE